MKYTILLSLVVLLLSSACSVADQAVLEALRDSGGGGPDTTGTDTPGTDTPQADMGTDTAGVVGPRDTCGDADPFIIADTTTDILIDTRSFTSAINELPGSGCRNLATAGNDAFLAIDPQAGEEWHFHLEASGEAATGRDPVLYLLQDGCVSSQCSRERLGNFCEDGRGEHFAFEFPNDNRWFIGIDDTNLGGGTYTLDAIKPTCGNAAREHGEACDGEANCTDQCRIMVSESSDNEQGFNFNFQEANEVVLPAGGELVIAGDIGDVCGYPDMFTLDVPNNHRLTVVQRRTQASACAGDETVPQIDIQFQNSAGEQRGVSTLPGGCVQHAFDFSTGGRFFVRVEDTRADQSRVLPYFLFFDLEPL